jgi:hypothetical protein
MFNKNILNLYYIIYFILFIFKLIDLTYIFIFLNVYINTYLFASVPKSGSRVNLRNL